MTRGIPPSVAAILYDVALRHGVTVVGILTHRRLRKLSYARHEAFWLVRSTIVIGHKPASFPLIGQWLGFDHASVYYGYRHHELRTGCSPDPDYLARLKSERELSQRARLESLDRRQEWSRDVPRVALETKKAVAA